MTQQYDNTNKGALFPNDRKTKPNQPDYKGQIDINGVEYWISGWLKDTNRGTIVSISAEPKDQNSRPQQQQGSSVARTLPAASTPQNQGNMPPNNSGGGWGQGSRPADDREPPMDFDDDIPF